MEIRHLRYFVGVAERCHFGRAARDLNTPQPNLTRHIKALEEELGTALFLRTKKSVTLTQDGKDLLFAASRVLRLVSQITEGKCWRKFPREVAVAHIPVVVTSLLPGYIRLWKAMLPEIRIQLSEGFPSEVIGALNSGDAELGFTLGPPNDSDLLSHRVGSFSYEVALPNHQNISNRHNRVSLRAMGDLKWITIPDKFRPISSCPLLTQMEALGFHRETRTIVGSQQALLSMVAAGEGFAVVPSELRKLNHPGIVFRKSVERLPPFDVYLIWRKDESDATVLKMASAISRSSGLGPGKRTVHEVMIQDDRVEQRR